MKGAGSESLFIGAPALFTFGATVLHKIHWIFAEYSGSISQTESPGILRNLKFKCLIDETSFLCLLHHSLLNDLFIISKFY